MKKIIAMIVAILMLSAVFVSCGNNDQDSETTTDPIDGTTTPEDTTTDGGPIDGEFVDVAEETVYVSTNLLNVRSEPNSEDPKNIIGALEYGKSVIRTGINEATGWSRIIFNGDTAYVYTTYLSPTQPPEQTSSGIEDTSVPDDEFEIVDIDTIVYITDDNGEHIGGDANIYSEANRAKNCGTLEDGTAVKITAVFYEKEDDNTYGWCKISYGENETAYIRNSMLKYFVASAEDTTASDTAAN